MTAPLSLKIGNVLSITASLAVFLFSNGARASVAYGSTNNFDTVNDTGSVCHGFEIELDDIHSTNITYTYDYNHYGIPKITEDDTVAGHPKVYVRYQAVYNSGTWSAFTAIPSAPIAPTGGHQFTNPSVNFGGEHFGVGYTAAPSSIKYNWLKDGGGGVLVNAGAVNVSTPVFNYSPAVPAQNLPAVVQAVIPVPPLPPVLEFGPASWVKEIKTTTHNNNPVRIEDLVSADSKYPNAKTWANSEPAEVEIEWQILQKDSGTVANPVPNGGPNAKLAAGAENLPNGNEVVTRRYEFYQYTGPLDAETGQAMGDTVGPDGIHGIGSVTYADHWDFSIADWATVTTDMATKVVVGKFLGAQMSGFAAGAKLDLIDHVQDGQVGSAYVNRTVILSGSTAFTGTTTGTVPPGMSVNSLTGVLSGTPTASGLYTFTVSAHDLSNATATKTYTMAVAESNGILPAQSTVTATASSDAEGSTIGSGSYYNGTNQTVTATAAYGYAFTNWTEGGVVVSKAGSYTFATAVDRTLVANFQPTTLSNWKAAHFTSVELTDPTVSGANANPTKDGIPNLLGYAFGLDPKVHHDHSTLPKTGKNGNSPALTYTRNMVATDLVYTVEISSDMKTWYSGATYTSNPVVLSDNGFTQSAQVTVLSQPAPTSRCYMRLRVTGP